jgi:hypothetical protein
MAIEIHIESSWDTDDGEGRKIEVSITERVHPGDDPVEDSYWFAGGNLEQLKVFIGQLIDDKTERFMGREVRECICCHRILSKGSTTKYCENCLSE